MRSEQIEDQIEQKKKSCKQLINSENKYYVGRREISIHPRLTFCVMIE